MSFASLAGVAAGSFVATNLDNLAITSSQMATSPPERARSIIKGQLIGFVAVVAIAAGITAALFEVSPRWVGLLGLVPIAFGINGARAWRHRAVADRRPLGAGAVTSAFVTIGASADNLAVYIPLLRGADRAGQFLAVGVFCVLDVVLCAIAAMFGHRMRAVERLQRLTPYVRPVLYCAIGVIVLWRAGTFGAL